MRGLVTGSPHPLHLQGDEMDLSQRLRLVLGDSFVPLFANVCRGERPLGFGAISQ